MGVARSAPTNQDLDGFVSTNQRSAESASQRIHFNGHLAA